MKNIIFDCTDYLKELVKTHRIPNDCSMYEKGYLIKLVSNEELHIYRIQTDINADYEKERGTTIVEFQRYNAANIFDAFAIYPNDIITLTDPKRTYNMNLREILKMIIEYDENHGFESWSITEYHKRKNMSDILKTIQDTALLIKF